MAELEFPPYNEIIKPESAIQLHWRASWKFFSCFSNWTVSAEGRLDISTLKSIIYLSTQIGKYMLKDLISYGLEMGHENFWTGWVKSFPFYKMHLVQKTMCLFVFKTRYTQVLFNSEVTYLQEGRKTFMVKPLCLRLVIAFTFSHKSKKSILSIFSNKMQHNHNQYYHFCP